MRQFLFALFCFLCVSAAFAFDLDVSEPAALEQVASTIARAGKFNVLVDPAARREVTLRLSDVTPEQALARLAREQGLLAQKLEFGQKRTTFVLLAERRSPPPLPPAPAEPGAPITIRVVKPTPIAKIAGLLSGLGSLRVEVAPGFRAAPVVNLEGLSAIETLYTLAVAIDARIDTETAPEGLVYRLVPRLTPRGARTQAPLTIRSAVERDGRYLARLTHDGIDYEAGPGWRSPGGGLELLAIEPAGSGRATLRLRDRRAGRTLSYPVMIERAVRKP